MALVPLDRLPEGVSIFIAERLMKNAPSGIRWLWAGVLPFIPAAVAEKLPGMLEPATALGIVTEGKLDTEKLRKFFSSAFGETGTLVVKGIVFNVEDGNAFVEILERLKE